jgi:hypothetical protein
MEKLCNLMESVPQNGHRKISTPFDGFDEAGSKILLKAAGQLLQ